MIPGRVASFFYRFTYLFSRDRIFVFSLARILGTFPRNIALYRLAFKHKSYEQESEGKLNTNNERLEFLGDAVLGTIVAHHLFKIFPYKDEGFLTEMRAKIVSREHLNKLSIKIGLEEYVKENVENKSKSIYGDALEALIGAIYLDRGYNGASRFIIHRLLKYHIDIDKLETTETNFKGKLLDWCQKEKKEIKFELVGEIGYGYGKKHEVQVIIDGKTYGKAMDFSKKKAEKRAAETTIKLLGINGEGQQNE